MSDPDPPKSNDPGTTAPARVKWGAQILQAFAALQSSVADLGRTAQASSEELVNLGKKVDVLDGIRADLAAYKATTTTEINYLKAWSRWALGIATLLILSLGGTAASVLSNQNAMLVKDDSMMKILDNTRVDTKREMDKIDKTVGELDKNVAEMKDAINGFSNSLNDFNRKSDGNAAVLEKISKTVLAMEKSKGESFSEFMTQRALLSKDDLKPRMDKASPLLFELKLPYESLSQASSSRPSATLAIPHSPILDAISFQIKVKRSDDSVLNISIASKESSLDAIEDFLRKGNGIIPLDLTIRTPIIDNR